MSEATRRNLLRELPRARDRETFESLIERTGFRLERIVSYGQTTPSGEWYDQGDDEWVLLLEGAAQLEYENGERQDMVPGDAVLLPAHCRHRVAWTDPQRATVWLALHYSSKD